MTKKVSASHAAYLESFQVSGRLLLLSTLILAPAFANVDPKIAEFCLKAQDFQGCVKSMSGDSSGSTTTIRQIQQRGADIAEGNQCPEGYAYLGGGNCREVQCRYGKSATGGHDYRLAGKKTSYGSDRWSCETKFIYRGSLRFSESETRAYNNPNCPLGEPEVGYNSTCDTMSFNPNAVEDAPEAMKNYYKRLGW